MARNNGKRLLALVLTVLLFSGLTVGAQAQQDAGPALGIDFSLKAALDPKALGGKVDRFVLAIARTLEMLKLSGHALVQDGQLDLTGDLDLNGMPAIHAHLEGLATRLRLTTSLFGENPVVITPGNYMPFLMKFFHYFDVPVQYIGVFTDSYAYLDGIKPAYDQWRQLVGGAESRSYSPEECVEMAGELSDSLADNSALSFWLQGLLQYVGLDDPLFEFFDSLPDWVSEAAQDDGLEIEVSQNQETWTLGGETVYYLTREEGSGSWEASLPAWEGYQLSASGTWTAGENGLDLATDWKLTQDDEAYAYFSLSGKGLPDGTRMQGEGTISLAFGGSGLDMDQTVKLGLNWDQRQNGGKTLLDGQVSLLNSQTDAPIFTISGQIAWGASEQNLVKLTRKDIKGIDLFCMNDETFSQFFAYAKGPILRSAIPFFLELPAGLIDGLVDYADDIGLLSTVSEGFGSDD